MRRSIRDNRALLLFLTMAIVAHVLLLLVPIVKEVARRTSEGGIVRLVLQAPQTLQETLPEKRRVPRVAPLETLPPPPESAVRSEQAVARADKKLPDERPAEVQPRVSSREIIARQFLMEAESTRAYVQAIDESRAVPDYFTAEKTTLEDALNQPVVQLPFRDTRVYELAFYEAGFNGAVDKFWDTVTVPFGFTTRNNTRIQCAWVLIFAGCSWGHKTLYYREAEKRKIEGEEQPY